MAFAVQITFKDNNVLTGRSGSKEDADKQLAAFNNSLRHDTHVDGVEWYAGPVSEIRAAQIIEPF